MGGTNDMEEFSTSVNEPRRASVFPVHAETIPGVNNAAFGAPSVVTDDNHADDEDRANNQDDNSTSSNDEMGCDEDGVNSYNDESDEDVRNSTGNTQIKD